MPDNLRIEMTRKRLAPDMVIAFNAFEEMELARRCYDTCKHGSLEQLRCFLCCSYQGRHGEKAERTRKLREHKASSEEFFSLLQDLVLLPAI